MVATSPGNRATTTAADSICTCIRQSKVYWHCGMSAVIYHLNQIDNNFENASACSPNQKIRMKKNCSRLMMSLDIMKIAFMQSHYEFVLEPHGIIIYFVKHFVSNSCIRFSDEWRVPAALLVSARSGHALKPKSKNRRPASCSWVVFRVYCKSRKLLI